MRSDSAESRNLPLLAGKKGRCRRRRSSPESGYGLPGNRLAVQVHRTSLRVSGCGLDLQGFVYRLHRRGTRRRIGSGMRRPSRRHDSA